MKNIPVRLKYLVNFQDITGKREEVPVFPAGSNLNAVAAWLKKTYGISVPGPGILPLLNGRGWSQSPEGLNTVLKEGDIVILMPSISGG